LRSRRAHRVTEKKRGMAEREKQDKGEGLRSREKKVQGKGQRRRKRAKMRGRPKVKMTRTGSGTKGWRRKKQQWAAG